MNVIQRLQRYWRLNDPNWVYVLLVVNLALFAVSMIVSWPEHRTGVFSPSREALYLLGASQPYRVLDGQWYRLIAAGYLHANVLHIGMNMFFLMQLGPIAQTILGPKRFITLYILSGLTGSLASMGWRMYSAHGLPNVEFGIAIGASTSMFGLLGFLFYWARRTPGAEAWSRSLFTCLLINIVIGLSLPVIDNAGHMGGLAGGLLVALAVVRPRHGGWGQALMSSWISRALLILTLVGLSAIPYFYFNTFGTTCRELYRLRPSVLFLIDDRRPTDSDIREELELVRDFEESVGEDFPVSVEGLKLKLKSAQRANANGQGWSRDMTTILTENAWREFLDEFRHYLGPTSGTVYLGR